MKKVFNIAIAALVLFATVGCSDYLDRPSKTSMDDESFWTSESNLRLFVNGAYGSYFNGYSDNWGQVYAPGVFSSGEYSDDRTTTGVQANILISVPADNWYRDELAYRGYWLARRGSGPWNFAYIRKWNLLIDRLEAMKGKNILSEEAYGHWMGVARFFRGWEYSRFVQSFGDVPYYDHVVATSDFDEMYKDRDPRTLVMNGVKDDFDYAIAHVRVNDGTDFVNRDVVATIASRMMLFEGTWYVYHKTDEAMKTCSDIDANAQKFLKAAQDYAELVMNTGKYGFNKDFRTLFGTLYETLTGKANEVLLYRVYNKSLNSASQHCIASYSGGNGGYEGQTQAGNLSTLKAWICQDGKPYSSSTVDNIASWEMSDMVVNRDPRFEATFVDEDRNSATGLYVEKFIDRTGVQYAYNGQACPVSYASCTNENGYPCVRYAETVLNWIEAKAELAEHFGGPAITQADLDKSINAIRTRPLDAEAIAKGVKQTAPLQLSWLEDGTFDPERTSDTQKACHSYAVTGKFVSPVLWEIRRERRMEFFLEQYRVLDIRRWGQLELMQGSVNPDILVGCFVNEPEAKNSKKGVWNHLTVANFGQVKVLPLVGTNADGTLKLGDVVTFDGKDDGNGNIVSSNAADMVGFLVPRNIQDRDERNTLVRNYLEPICTDVISQYKDKKYTITQNPGWEQ